MNSFLLRKTLNRRERIKLLNTAKLRITFNSCLSHGFFFCCCMHHSMPQLCFLNTCALQQNSYSCMTYWNDVMLRCGGWKWVHSNHTLPVIWQKETDCHLASHQEEMRRIYLILLSFLSIDLQLIYHSLLWKIPSATIHKKNEQKEQPKINRLMLSQDKSTIHSVIHSFT